MQNRSHAVMAQRTEAADGPDDFPTPPWATRAFMEHVLVDEGAFDELTCLEPACGSGHMAMALKEYFGTVKSYEIDQREKHDRTKERYQQRTDIQRSTGDRRAAENRVSRKPAMSAPTIPTTTFRMMPADRRSA